MPDIPEVLPLLVAFEERIQDRSSTTRVDLGWGTGLAHHELPLVWDLNFLRVEVAEEAPDAAEVAEHASALLEPVASVHRRITVPDDDAGRALCAGCEALGWVTTRFLWMVQTATPSKDADTSIVKEIAPRDLKAAREPFIREEAYGDDDDAVGQLLDRLDVTAQATEMHSLAAIIDGEPASICELYVEDGIAQIEDVATLRRYRGRGLARAVVTAAVKEAGEHGADTVFLVADAEDWPKELYRSLGFEDVGYTLQSLWTPNDQPSDD